MLRFPWLPVATLLLGLPILLHAEDNNGLPPGYSEKVLQAQEAIKNMPRLKKGDKPAQVLAAWGEPEFRREFTEVNHNIEVWLYTVVVKNTIYPVKKVFNEDTRQWELQEQEQEILEEYVGRQVRFVDGLVDSWKMFPTIMMMKYLDQPGPQPGSAQQK